MKKTTMTRMMAMTAILSVSLISCGSKQSKTSDSISDGIEATTLIDEKPGVDLGLSVNWAECNVGAESPEEVGVRIPLGNTKGTMKYVDHGSNISGTEYDIASVKMGDGWRMPTGDEFRELRDECEWTMETINGRKGYRVTGKNGNSIFLPCTGSNFQPESFKDMDIKDQGGTDPNREGNYWFGAPTDFNVMKAGLNHIMFDVSSGQRQFYWCEPYSLNAVRAVHD